MGIVEREVAATKKEIEMLERQEERDGRERRSDTMKANMAAMLGALGEI